MGLTKPIEQLFIKLSRYIYVSKNIIRGVLKMTELEKKIVYIINEMHRQNLYCYDKYQMLHKVKYKNQMNFEHIKQIRERYERNCFEAAYELKTYYMENNILSNTIVLKMRPKSPDVQDVPSIYIHNELENRDYEYTHHAIEIFKEYGRYKVFDILHSDRIMWLEDYLDNVCSTNSCSRVQLRYDIGYLAPCHVLAGNMQELTDVMRFLDKKYGIGKPRLTLINLSGQVEESIFMSDDIYMDFDELGRELGTDFEQIKKVWLSIYDRLMSIRFNILHLLCLGHIIQDPLFSMGLIENIFDDETICKMLEKYI